MPIVKTSVTIRNVAGLHARPAMSFVDAASAFKANVRVRLGSQDVDGKSIMQMLLLAASQGAELEIEADGEDADDAVAALEALVARKFDED